MTQAEARQRPLHFHLIFAAGAGRLWDGGGGPFFLSPPSGGTCVYIQATFLHTGGLTDPVQEGDTWAWEAGTFVQASCKL